MMPMLSFENINVAIAGAPVLRNVSLPFLNQVEQGKPTAQIGKVLEVCRRHGVEVIFHLPAKPDGEGGQRCSDESCGNWPS